jgi:Spy/CpxP family protein refolding chaperone
MRNTKRTIFAVTVVVALALMGSWAFAHGRWGGRGHMGPGSDYGDELNLSPEQQEKVRAENQKFYEETAGLRTELYQKRLELRALLVDPSAEPETIKAKQREVLDLERQLQEKGLDHQLALRDVAPELLDDHGPCGYGPGYGHRMGWGHRHGGHRMGFGMGGRMGFGGGPSW